MMQVRRPSPLDLVQLSSLMSMTSGCPEVRIGLVDGPVAANHPDLENISVKPLGNEPISPRSRLSWQSALDHGTFVAGILTAKRSSSAPAICPSCTLLVRPIFGQIETDTDLPSCSPEELVAGILDCTDAGARILNLSVTLSSHSTRGQSTIQEALDYAARRGVVVVAASGNEGTIGGSVISRHPAVIPVVAYDSQARPIGRSNLGPSIGRRGLGAPGDKVISLGRAGESLVRSGTSIAAPFVAGTIALLWSLFPAAAASRIRAAILHAAQARRASIVPPLLNAWDAYQFLRAV